MKMRECTENDKDIDLAGTIPVCTSCSKANKVCCYTDEVDRRKMYDEGTVCLPVSLKTNHIILFSSVPYHGEQRTQHSREN